MVGGRAASSFSARGSSLTFLATFRSSSFKLLQFNASPGLRVTFSFRQPLPPIRLTHLLQRRYHTFIVFIVDQSGCRLSPLRDDHCISCVFHPLHNLFRLALQLGDRNNGLHTHPFGFLLEGLRSI